MEMDGMNGSCMEINGNCEGFEYILGSHLPKNY